MTALTMVAKQYPVVFPVHPRTRQSICQLYGDQFNSRVQFIEPLGYLDFLALISSAKLVLTDSGEVQEETTYLGIPCLTVRPNTECPITIEMGTNRLVPAICRAIVETVQELMRNQIRNTYKPDLWDGKAAKRIVRVMMTQNRVVPQ